MTKNIGVSEYRLQIPEELKDKITNNRRNRGNLRIRGEIYRGYIVTQILLSGNNITI